MTSWLPCSPGPMEGVEDRTLGRQELRRILYQGCATAYCRVDAWHSTCNIHSCTCAHTYHTHVHREQTILSSRMRVYQFPKPYVASGQQPSNSRAGEWSKTPALLHFANVRTTLPLRGVRQTGAGEEVQGAGALQCSRLRNE